VTRPLKSSLLLILPAGYTAFAAGPFVWVAIMSLRTTTEIMADHFALPGILHWEKFPIAWFNSNYNVYFKNSAMIVLSAVVILTIVGAMAAHCLSGYRLPLHPAIHFIL